MSLAFARVDLRSWLFRTQTLLPLVLVAGFAIAVPVPGIGVVGAALVTSLLVSAPFLVGEKARLGTLYGVLPVSRTSVVAGRALAILTYAALAFAVGIGTTYVVAAVRGTAVPGAVLAVVVAAAVAFVGLSLAIQLPVLFRIGFARGRFVAYAPALVVAGLEWLGQAVGIIGGDGSTAGLPTLPIVLGCVAAGVVGVVVAIAVASRTYGTREIR